MIEQEKLLYPDTRAEQAYSNLLATMAVERSSSTDLLNKPTERILVQDLLLEVKETQFDEEWYGQKINYWEHVHAPILDIYKDFPRHALILLSNKKYNMLASAVNAIARPEDYEIVTGLLALPQIKKHASAESQLSLTRSLIRITYQMYDKNPQDPRLEHIAHTTITNLKNSFGRPQSPISESSVTGVDETSIEAVQLQTQANLLTALSMTHASEADRYMRKHRLNASDYDLERKIPTSYQEFLTYTDFISRIHRENLRGHEKWDMDDQVERLLDATTEDEYNYRANIAFVYGNRHPGKKNRSHSLPRMATVLLEENQIDILAPFVNALAHEDDFGLVAGLLSLRKVKEGASIESQQLISRALIRLTYDIRQGKEADPRLTSIAQSIIDNLYEGVPQAIIGDLVSALSMTHTRQADEFIARHRDQIDPQWLDEAGLSDAYFEGVEFGDHDWNEAYYNVLIDINSWNSHENRLTDGEYLDILETSQNALKEKLHIPFYFEKVIGILPSFYKNGGFDLKNRLGKQEKYSGVAEFAKQFIYDNIDTFERMMKQMDNPYITRKVMEAIQYLYTQGDHELNEKATAFLLRNLSYALEQVDRQASVHTASSVHINYYDLTRALFTYGNQQQQEQAHTMFTQFYTEKNRGAIKTLPLESVLLYQSPEQRAAIRASLVDIFRDGDVELIKALEYPIVHLYKNENQTLHTQASLLVKRIMKVYGLDYNDFIDAWKDSAGEYKTSDSTYENFRKIIELELREPGVTRRLYKFFNKKCFAAESTDRLLQQDRERRQQGDWVAYYEGVYEWQGKKYWFESHILQEAAREAARLGVPLRSVDLDNEAKAYEMTNRLARRYGVPKITIAEMHGSKKSLGLQSFDLWYKKHKENPAYNLTGNITPKVLEKYAASEFFENPFEPGDILILSSCSVGQPEGIAEALARTFGITVYAPEENINASITKLRLTRNAEGQYGCDISYAMNFADGGFGDLLEKPLTIRTMVYNGLELQRTNPITAGKIAPITMLHEAGLSHLMHPDSMDTSAIA